MAGVPRRRLHVRRGAQKGERRHARARDAPEQNQLAAAPRADNMLRLVAAALRGNAERVLSASVTNAVGTKSSLLLTQVRCLGALAKQLKWQDNSKVTSTGTNILSNSLNKLLEPKTQLSVVPCRTVIRFSLRKGKRKTVKTVLRRFYRLNWGIWIRTMAGRHRHLWKKSAARRKRLQRHVFTNATQSYMLDKMVNKFWKRPKYYVDDPYEPYHTREEFWITRKKPTPLPEE